MQLTEHTYFGENNRYYLERLLGRGGFSEVWLAQDNLTHQQIALKVYVPGTGLDDEGLQTFSEEFARVSNLHHQNLLTSQHVDAWKGMPYLTMSYCAHGSLVKKIGKMSEPEIRKVLHDVAAGLAYLHAHDVIHQDIKPDNILLDDAGNYVITDFGISTRTRSTLRKSVAASSSHSGGTIAYMGPERFGKEPAPVKASDIWSLGAMCFELLEGVLPFGEIGGGMQKGGAEIPSIQANVSDALKYIISKMLQKETWDRPDAATLVEWINNPQNISIDYSLLGLPIPSEPFVDQFFSISPENIQVPSIGGNAVVYVHSNAKSWMIKDLANWVHWDKKQDDYITLQFDKNKSGQNRECLAKVSAVFDDGGSESATLTISQPSLSKRNIWIKWLMGVAVIIISVFVGVRACSIHQEKIRIEQIRQQQLFQAIKQTEEKARIAEQEKKAAEERARTAEEQLKRAREGSALPISNGVFQLKSGALLTIPSCFTIHNIIGSDDQFFNADQTMNLFVSSEGFRTLQSAYSAWTYNYGKTITYQRITDKFAVVTWKEGQDDGVYCRADLINGKVNYWILRWDRNSVDTEARRMLDNFEIKFVK